MSIDNTKILPQKLLLSMGFVCGTLSVMLPNTVSSQTTPVIRILLVTASNGTTFKREESWYLQGRDIRRDDQKCTVRQGDKFFVSSVLGSNTTQVVSPNGNGERLRDYWEVTFEKPAPCNQQGEGRQTWFVFKAHVQQLQAVVR